MKMKIWGLVPITKNQLIIIETIFFTFFFILTIFFFSYEFPDYLDDPLIELHAKYLKYVCVLAAFLTVMEAQYYLNIFIKRNLKLIKAQKDQIQEQNTELNIQKQEILENQEEIRAQRDFAQEQHSQISRQKEKITASIKYASRIQTALLPPNENIPDFLEHFILFKPKDIVSGDYYWISKKGDKIIFVAADCTGHGVPGAFMSVLGIAFLNEIVNKADNNINAADILNRLRDKVITSFHQKETQVKRRDGMDVALYILDIKNQEIQYAGANNPLYLLRRMQEDSFINEDVNSQSDDGAYILTQVKADRMPIGLFPINNPFKNHIIKLRKRDTIYIFSDGYADQFGGQKGKKYLSGRFKRILLDIQDKSMAEQKVLLNTSIEEWRNFINDKGETYAQMDDILIFGVRI